MSQFPALAPAYGRDLLVHKIIRNIALVLGFALVPLGLAVPAFAAGAGQNPCETPTPVVTLTAYTGHTPCPSPTPTDTGTPTPTPQRFAQEDFDLGLSSLRPNGEVLATGPVHFNVGQTQSVNPLLDIFSQAGNGVNLHHEGLTGATIDRTTCTINVDENDLPWIMFRGTGLFRNAIGFGHYDLRGIFSFPTVRGHCSLPTNLVIDPNRDLSEQLSADNLTPAYFNIGVQGTGFARVSRHRPPCRHASQVPGVVRAGVLTG